MKINIEEAKEEFIKYTENFNTKDKNVKRKQQHSIREIGRASCRERV